MGFVDIQEDHSTCSGGADNDQHVTAFITTLSAGASGIRSLRPPSSASDTTSGLKLTSAFVVSDDTTATFTVDPTNFMSGWSQDTETGCGTSAPSFGFE